MGMRALVAALACVVLVASGQAGGQAPGRAPAAAEFFSFEEDFEGWTSGDIVTSGSQVEVARSEDRAKDGRTSVKLRLHSRGEVPTAAAWIQRAFKLAPNKTYEVEVGFSLATADSGGPAIAGPSGVMAGTTRQAPVALRDAIAFVQGDFIFSNRSPRYRWLTKRYEYTANTDDAGELSVIVGVVAAGLDASYYVDSVRIGFTERQAGAVSPVISSAVFAGKKLTIEGAGFGPSPRVIIKNVDRTDFLTSSSDHSIRLRGGLASLGLSPGSNRIRVVDDTTAAASEPFDFIVTI